MLVLKYFAYAGSGLLALLFGLNWLVPETPITAVRTEVNRSSIRISSIERLPDRIVFDTSAPQPRLGRSRDSSRNGKTISRRNLHSAIRRIVSGRSSSESPSYQFAEHLGCGYP